MSSFAAQQATQSDHRIHFSEIGQGAGGGGNLPCARNAHHVNIAALGSASQQCIERSFEQPVGNHGIPARHHDGELHSLGGEIALYGYRLAPLRIGPGPKRKRETGLRLNGKDARLPVGLGDRREACNGCIPTLRQTCLAAQPRLGSLINGIESGDFDHQVGGRGKLAFDKLQIAQRSQKRSATATAFLPALAGSKTQSGKETGQPLVDHGAAGRTKKGDPLDHAFILSCCGGRSGSQKVLGFCQFPSRESRSGRPPLFPAPISLAPSRARTLKAVIGRYIRLDVEQGCACRTMKGGI